MSYFGVPRDADIPDGNQFEAGEIYDHAEEFMPLEQMEDLVWAALCHNDRIDEEGRIKPLMMMRQRITGAGGFSIDHFTSNDLFLPPQDDTVYWDEDGYEVKEFGGFGIYSALTGRDATITLTEGQISELRKEAQHLGKAVMTRGYQGELAKWQEYNAYHIKSTQLFDAEGRLAGQTRMYLPGGANAMYIARQVIEAGADFRGAKMWLPDLRLGEREFRDDTLLFHFKTTEQLVSTVNVVRQLYQQGAISFTHDHTPLVGLPIKGLPGAYIGQNRLEESFNGRMEDFLKAPIWEACNSSGLRPGDELTKEWLTWIAGEARILALGNAEDSGANPLCHAMLRSQDPEIIYDAIK